MKVSKRSFNDFTQALKLKFNSSHPNSTELINKLIIHSTSTGGYAAEIISFDKTWGVELWTDEVTNTGNPKLAITIRSNNKKKIEDFSVTIGEYYLTGNKTILMLKNGIVKLKFPLPEKYFNNYIIEPYTETYLTLYFNNPFYRTSYKDAKFINLVCDEIVFLQEAINYFNSTKQKDDLDFPKIENRLLVRQHIIRERNSTLAKKAKERDDYTCQICDFNFITKYGAFGNLFAEAHHKVPLQKSNYQLTSTVDSLLTVCSNCHRMLHKMSGAKTDIIKLKRIVKSNTGG